MPKVALRYVGDDKAEIQRLKATDGVRFVEPVDAKEILAVPDCEYEVDEDNMALVGQPFDPGRPNEKFHIPNLHGDDAELTTGIPANKYARQQVVQGVPDGSVPTSSRATDTRGNPLPTAGEVSFGVQAGSDATGPDDDGTEAAAESKPAAKKRARR